jgi:hypothetical protein
MVAATEFSPGIANVSEKREARHRKAARRDRSLLNGGWNEFMAFAVRRRK